MIIKENIDQDIKEASLSPLQKVSKNLRIVEKQQTSSGVAIKDHF